MAVPGATSIRHRTTKEKLHRSLPIACCLLAGCTSFFEPQPYVALDQPALPAKKQIRLGQFLILTDADLSRDHPLLKSLEGLQEQVCKELHLPQGANIVYVF